MTRSPMPATRTEQCPRCDGDGYIVIPHRIGYTTEPCPDCGDPAELEAHRDTQAAIARGKRMGDLLTEAIFGKGRS